MRGYQTSPRLNSYMPRHRFLYATTCSNTCRFWLVFYEPLCWEASYDRCFIDRGCEGSPISTLVWTKKQLIDTAISENERDMISTRATPCPLSIKLNMDSRRVTSKVTSQIVRLSVTCRSSLGHHVSYLRTQHLPPDASCKPRFYVSCPFTTPSLALAPRLWGNLT